MVIKDGENSLVSSFYFSVASFTSSKNKTLQLDISQLTRVRKRNNRFDEQNTKNTLEKKVIAFSQLVT